MCTVEMLDGGTDGGLQLNDLFAIVRSFVVNNDLHIQLAVVDNALDGFKRDPQVVSVEDLELFDGLEIVGMRRGHLSNLEQSDLSLVVDDRSSLDICLRLISYFHQEF